MFTEDDLLKADEELNKRRTMTIIVAMKEADDSLLIGADTMTIEDGDMKDSIPSKLYKHNTHNIVWGCGGNREISRHEFSPWLQSLNIQGDWEWLKLAIGDKIAELNGRQRVRASKAGVEAKPEALICCLLVGWLNEESQIYEFTHDARIDSYKPEGFKAIGIGAPFAYGAYGALQQTKGIAPQDKFKIILKTVVQKALRCGGAVHIKRVTKDAVENIT